MGQRWFTLTLDGFAAHAGTTPMHSRRDALTAFAELALKVEEIGYQHQPDGRARSAWRRSRRTRATWCHLAWCAAWSFAIRAGCAEAMESALHQAAESLAARGVTATVERIFDYAPIAFNPQCLAAQSRP
jgi:N-carbamoyl-L-amino-acid hydrolase